MKNVTIGIVDDNLEFCHWISEHLQERKGIKILFIAHNGLEAMENINNDMIPDVLLLDITMPKLDGLGFLEKINNTKLKKYPHVIVISANKDDIIVQKSLYLGAKYYMIKPVYLEVLLQRIHTIQEGYHNPWKENPSSPKEKLYLRESFSHGLHDDERYITTILTKLGIPSKLHGYTFLTDSILMVIEDRTLLHSVTKVLYPEIAKQNDSSVDSVESCIRKAIKIAWDADRKEAINEIFSYGENYKNMRPTNAEFIGVIANKVRLEREPY